MYRLVLFLALTVCTLAQSTPSGTWTTKDGKRFVAELLAADGLRATFGPHDKKPKFVRPFTDLAAEDALAIRNWRLTNFRAPLVDADALAPWPKQAGGEAVSIKALGEDAGSWTYESANFRLTSDLKLPDSAIRDLAMVMEATRSLLIALPLGLHAGGERDKYPVLMKSTEEAYQAVGGPAGSGGYYDARNRRMLLLLPNLGIEQKESGLQLNYSKNLFVLKHEVTHQLISRWHPQLPMWLWEGLAEVVAALPYSQGRYNLQNPGGGMKDYILKWQKARGEKTVLIIPATQLMALDERGWRKAIAQQSAYDMYNSAGLLAWYFIQKDGGKRLAAFLNAQRHGRTDDETDLLRGQSRESVAQEVSALARRIGLPVAP